MPTGSAFPSGAAHGTILISPEPNSTSNIGNFLLLPGFQLIFSRSVHVVPPTIPHVTQLPVSDPSCSLLEAFLVCHQSLKAHWWQGWPPAPERWPSLPEGRGAAPAPHNHILHSKGPCCLEQPCHTMDGEKALRSLVWSFPLAFLYSLQPWSNFCVWTEFISFLNSTMCKPPGQMLACHWAERPFEKPQEWRSPLWERSVVTWDWILTFRRWGPLTSLHPSAAADAHFLSYLPLWTHRRKTRCQ